MKRIVATEHLQARVTHKAIYITRRGVMNPRNAAGVRALHPAVFQREWWQILDVVSKEIEEPGLTET